MKHLIISLSTSLLLFACGNKEELTAKTEKLSGAEVRSTFKVWGNCETCKETIEGSLKKDGITSADWNVDSKIITVTYDTTKINLDAIEKSIASVGYDNIKYKGNDKAYSELPQCCKYDRK